MVLGFGTALSITVSIALLCVIVFAALFGSCSTDARPVQNRPGTGHWAMRTTVNDIIGLMIYFAIGGVIADYRTMARVAFLDTVHPSSLGALDGCRHGLRAR